MVKSILTLYLARDIEKSNCRQSNFYIKKQTMQWKLLYNIMVIRSQASSTEVEGSETTGGKVP
jgi:hypothetical protein